MRILYIDQYFSDRQGISGTRSFEFARRMVDRGHRVTMLTTASRYSSLFPQRKFLCRLKVDGIDVVSLRIGYSHMMGFARRLWSFLSFMTIASVLGVFSRRHDVVFATSTPLSVAVPGLVISTVRAIPFVFEVRDLWPRAPIELGILRNRAAIWLLDTFERLVYRRARKIIALSPGMRDGVIAAGASPDKVHVVPNACDTDLFDALPPKNEIRKQLAWGDEFVAVYAGTIGMANGLEYLVDLADAYRNLGGGDLRLILIGEGNERSGLQEKVLARNIDFIQFVDPLSRQEVARYIAAADMGLTLFKNLPVLATNSPNKLFDYLAAGLPCAVNSPGWTAQAIQDAQAGQVWPPDQPEQAAQELAKLVADPEQAKRMAGNARRLADQTYSRDRLFDQLMGVLAKAESQPIGGLEFAIKAGLDVGFAAIGLLLLSPVIAAIALVIKRDCPGPVFFRQERAGRAGRVFRIFKFRTMVPDAADQGLRLNIERNDTRITRVGHFLREWSLDELPQLFNVLFLQMSLVGPRPALPTQVARYSERQARRLWVRPGITGLAQVSGRNLLPWSARLEKDFQYVENYSLWLDIRIFFRTFSVVLSRKGLYEPDAGVDDSFNQF